MEVETSRLAEGEDLTNLYPWRMFQTKPAAHTPAPAVRFHNIPSLAGDLIGVYDFFSRLADQYAGIQNFDTGVNPTRGAAGTASGLSMLMSASNRQIKRVMASIDNVIEETVRQVHTHVMLHGKDEDAKGDIEIEAIGVASLVAKEQQQMRKTEFLAATNNPVDTSIMGPEGRAELLRDVVQSFDLNPDRVIPDRDKLRAQIQQAAMAAVPENPEPPASGGSAPGGRRVAGGADARLF